MGKFEIFKDKKKEFRFRLKARNGEIILTSESYKAKAKCKKGIASVVTNSQKDEKFNIDWTRDEIEVYFVLKGGNGEIIGVSEPYDTKEGAENGIKSVKENAPISEIVDLSVK